MILVSIQPFATRKIFLVLVALVGFSALCFADPVLMAEHYVPRAGASESAPTSGLLQQTSADLIQTINQAQFDALRPVDLPSRDQRLLPMSEPAVLPTDWTMQSGGYFFSKPPENLV